MGWMRQGVTEEDKLSREEAGKVLRRAFRMIRPYRRSVIAAVVVMIGSTAAILAGPQLVRYGIDQGRHHGWAVDRAAGGYLIVAVIALGLSRAQIVLVSRVGESFLRDLRVRIFNHIQAMSMGFFDREPTGRLVARMTSDIDSLQDLIQQGLVLFVTNGLLVVFTIVVMAVTSPLLAGIAFAGLPFVIWGSVWFQRVSNRAYLDVRDRISQTLTTLQEGLSGVRVIQAFGQEDRQVGRFSKRNQAQYAANMKAVKIQSLYFPLVEFSGIASTALVVGVGGVLNHEKRVSLGVIIAFVLYLTNLYEPIQQLSQVFNTVQSAGAALAKIFGLLDMRSPITESPGAVDLPERGNLAVRDVGFAYGDGPPVLHDVNLEVAAGERLALVGPTGAGKSTLAKLMSRFYDPTQGSVSFAGVDLRRATLHSLRERIVVVPQEGYLFQGTVMDNVRLGRAGATDDEVRRAMELIGVLERFEALPEGLATEVRERGSRLSAGERQLVSLARAALTRAELLVLDEATSSLDPGTEVVVELAMARLMEGRTVVVIAHRLSTAERADRVAVIDEGGLAELGTHTELVAAGGRYAALFASWTSGVGAPAGG
jgi:ATP-binding cassette subfamily B protein